LSNPVQYPFRKSRRCDTGTCVEVSLGDQILVRNSTAPDEIVAFTKAEWRVFVEGVREGEFHLD